MGEERSLPSLARQYTARSATGEAVPTRREQTLKQWSSTHGWQQRCKDRIAEEAERTREENRKRVRAYRNRLMLAIEADSSLYAQKVTKGQAVLAEDAASLERMTKLYFQLAEEPLADRHEVTGAAGGPVQVEVDVPPDGELAQFLANAAALAAGQTGGGDLPGEPGTD